MLNKKTKYATGTLALVVILAASCRKEQNNVSRPAEAQSESSLKTMMSENGNNPDEMMISPQKSASYEKGYVYTESNDASQNKIIIYNQNADGSLTWNSTVASGGPGNGAGLGSQGALVLNEDHTLLLAVNAGDNSISSFLVHNDGSLKLADTKSSGGTLPVSVCVNKNLVYVVNSTSANICGFYVDAYGMLTKIGGSLQALSNNNAAPAQISFDPNGYVLYVTEKMTNKIASFTLNEQGAANAGTFTSSVGSTPFGFSFAKKNSNYLIVSNAAGGAVNAGNCTSYLTDNAGNVNAVNGAIANYQTAPCWVAVTRYGRFAFVTNTGSNSISSYYISPAGALYLVFFTVTKADEAPLDIIVSSNNHYVYAVNSISHTITEYKRGLLGTLKPIGKVKNIPDYASGLAAY